MAGGPPRKITLLRAAVPMRCPSCGAQIPWRRVTAQLEFACAECGHGMRLRDGYFRVLYILAMVVISLIAYAAGIRDEALFATAILGLWPTYFLLVFINMRLFPPDVEPTGDFRGILYGINQRNDAFTASDPPAETSVVRDIPTRAPADEDPRQMFKTGRDHRSLEEIVIRGAVIVMAGWLVWTAARPLIYRIAPELGATKSGPSVFPVTVHIGEETVDFTNGSTVPWICRAELGFGKEYLSTFSIEPQHTRELSYLDFRSSGAQVDPAVSRRAARGKITMACAEPSGITHFWQFD